MPTTSRWRRKYRLPPYVTFFRDRHGRPRYRYRRGRRSYYLKTAPGTKAFEREYEACLSGAIWSNAQASAVPAGGRTLSRLIDEYYRTPQFQELAPSTSGTYRNILENIRRQHGGMLAAKLTRQDVLAIRNTKASTPGSANNWLDRIRALMKLAMDLGWRKDDPAHGISALKTTGEGHHSWTEDEIAQFEARHPPGSPARRALRLLLCTVQRRSDVVRMGPKHLRGNRIWVRQQKTGEELLLPLHPDLKEELDRAPRGDAAFLVTSYGKPFTAAGFGNWFRDRCDEAKLPHCSAHGLRHAGARRLAEAGCTAREIMAMTGHKSLREVQRYTDAVDQVRLADQAMRKHLDGRSAH